MEKKSYNYITKGIIDKDDGLRQDQLFNLWGPVQNENAGPLVWTSLRISGWQRKSKLDVGPF